MIRSLRMFLCIAVLAGCVSAQTRLNGAGATFPYPIYSKWFSEYQKEHGNVEVNYQSIGSGGGIRQLQAGTVDFGASDMPLNDEQLKGMGKPIIQFPTVLGSVVPAYNLPGVSGEIKFTPEALAGIYLGKITKWNDKALTSANPGLNLPDKDIVVVHRSDGSGTTFVWTDYLSKISPEWKSQVGSNTSVKWPVGLGGKGNEGVAGVVAQQPGAVGYVELIYALQNKITFGPVKNAAGNFVKASLQSTTAAAASVKSMPADFRISITDASGKDAYPISSFTYLLVPVQWQDQSRKGAMVGFLEWMLDKGEPMVTQLDYAPLPKQVADMERAKIKEIH
ncbi:MAG TPA: phosphate ABC transporter substrate-binding protein PstS [Candidatus Binatia bacterium]|nr:phosphate ABC transporter substrate-binding protein PstS [Candidatus Binatia bacterium]